MPHVIVPYTRVHPVTQAVLNSYNIPIQYEHLNDDDAYRRLLKRIWNRGETVIIVEHDIVPWPGAIEELWQCPCQWGAYSYPLLNAGPGIFHGFGCTKFTKQFIREFPNVWDEPRRWDSLDSHLWFTAQERFQPHPHRPPVIHLSEREIGKTR